MMHRYNWDTDRCVCGGVVVYFENGETGDGCEVYGHPWAVTLPPRITRVLQELKQRAMRLRGD
jgi:hypothetical protein